MSSPKFLQQSFVGGEIAPEMKGRIEDISYANGLAICRNFLVRPQGAADNRAGLRFVREVKDSTKRVRLIPFTFSGDQTMVIELGEKYARFHTDAATVMNGAAPYEIETPYLEAHLMDIHHVQSADILTLVHPNYPPQELRRYGVTDWRLQAIAFTPTVTAPANLTISPSRVPQASGVVQINLTYRYKVTAVKDKVESKPSDEVTATNDLYTSGNKITLSWQAVAGADSYFIYRYQSGMYGYLGQTQSTSFEDSGAAPDMAKTPPQYKDIFDKADHYPSAVSYYQQRRVFAGTKAEPQKIWMTRSGTEADMSYSVPARDDDRIEIRVAAREANHIRHIVPLGNLLILTGSAEWKVSTQNTDVLTSTSIAVSPHSYIGANNVQPVIVNASLIYGAARGGHVREMTYSWQAGGYVTGDLSLRAPHLFDRRQILDMAYGKAPYPIVWFISSNGWLLGNTYVPEQEIGAWHRHDTDGSFESCAVVAEGDEDMLYVVVRRHINGRDVRYIERLESRSFATPADAFFVDSGLSYDGVPTTTVRGLDHLEGKTVSILADGAVHPQRVVTGGAIALDHPAAKIHVGLPIGRKKNVNEIWLDVLASSGIWAGPHEDALVESKQRSTEPPGSPPHLKTGEVQLTLKPDWNEYGQILMRQRDPLPLTIVSLTVGVAIA